MRVGVTITNLKRAVAYTGALAAVGLDHVLNPDSMEALDGLLLAGGADVNPAMYGEERHPETESPDDARDVRESRLLSEALERDLPVFGICRGHQFFNVAFGGRLIQHLPNVELHRQKAVDYAHDVLPLPDSMLASLVGVEPMPVNSRHHQGVAVAAPGLHASAVCPSDNLVEALEVPGKRFALAVQWHPEDRMHVERDRLLFEAFAQALRCPRQQKP